MEWVDTAEEEVVVVVTEHPPPAEDDTAAGRLEGPGRFGSVWLIPSVCVLHVWFAVTPTVTRARTH